MQSYRHPGPPSYPVKR
jgi:RNA recognition motif-containing protein